jgi:subtilisin-like proprotein convertase family protein
MLVAVAASSDKLEGVLKVAGLVPWLLAACLAAACAPSVDYGATHYRCDESGTCPDGFSCVEGECVTQLPRPDAGGDDRPDAAGEDPVDMIRSESNSEILIPDNDDDGVADEIYVAASCTILDITVDLDITHGWPAELAVWLTSPWHTDVLLHEVGGDGSGDGIVGTYPTTLTPEDSLQTLVGEDGDGEWQLWVADVSSGDVGVLHGWAITLWCEP